MDLRKPSVNQISDMRENTTSNISKLTKVRRKSLDLTKLKIHLADKHLPVLESQKL
jgi:hypothetical protein